MSDWLFDHVPHFLFGFALLALAAIPVAWWQDIRNQVPFGVVVELTHREAWTEMRPVKAGTVTTVVPIIHPERWGVVLEGKRMGGGFGRYEWSIPESEWLALHIGQEVRR